MLRAVRGDPRLPSRVGVERCFRWCAAGDDPTVTDHDPASTTNESPPVSPEEERGAGGIRPTRLAQAAAVAFVAGLFGLLI